MREAGAGGRFEAEVRAAFLELARSVLPSAAAARGWPVTSPECFERMLLEHVTGARCDMGAGGPASRARLIDLILAVELGARLLDGAACAVEMDQRARELRPPEPSRDAPRRRSGCAAAACEGAVADLFERAVAAQAPTRRARR